MDPVTLSPIHRFPPQPRLAASHSPSRSPSRRQHITNQGLSSLLSDLSPSSTLEALHASDLVQTEDKTSKGFVQKSATSASASERAWGVKAALAGTKVEEWYAEVGTWVWSGFDQAPLEEPADGKARHDNDHIDKGLPPKAFGFNGSNRIEKHGSSALSLRLVQEYEKRIQTIRDDMETLEIEDLKDYMRNTHCKAGSRRSSLRDSQSSFGLAAGYDHLDDFTAIITATIVQALPTISRLETLLNTWSTRLLILRQVPSFLIELNNGRESMVSASIAIGDTKRRKNFSRKAFSDIRAVLQDQIAELGRKLDMMLDLLEGSADTLPDAWIDGLDNMENQYSSWVVKAERLAMDKVLRIERLEKDYTQDRTDELSDLEEPLEIPHTKSSLGIDVQIEEVKRLRDSDFDLTPPDLIETLKTENALTDSWTKRSAETVDLEPVQSRGVFTEQGLSEKAELRGLAVNSVDGQSSNGLSGGLRTPSLPSRPSHRPPPLVFTGLPQNVQRPDSSDSASDTSGSESVTSNYSSTKSSPEIQSAVVAEYIGTPVRVTSPTIVNKDVNKEPTTPKDLSLWTPGQESEGDGVGDHQRGLPSTFVSEKEQHKRRSWHVQTRRASLQSFEIVPKHEIRQINVQRSGSYSSAFSLSDPEFSPVQPSRLTTSFLPQGESKILPTTRPLPTSKEAKDQRSSAPVQVTDLKTDMPKRQPLYRPPPPVPIKSPTSAQSGDQELHAPRQQLPYRSPPAVAPRPARVAQSLDSELDVAKHRIPYHSAPPMPPKAAHRFEQVSDLSPGSTPVKIRQMKTSHATTGHASGQVETPQRTADRSPRNFDDELEERISSILTELPTQIRLTSRPEPDAPEVERFHSTSDLKTPKSRSPAWRLKRRQTSTSLPSMSLVPAQPKNSQSRSSTTEPEIKLYHLHEAGRNAPIKLFVRLVGEGGERVMVRIGGGWADLGEYLREYAGHHGRRSVSDSPFDIKELPSSSPPTASQSPRSRPGSRPASPNSSTKKRPASRLSSQHPSPAIFNGPHTPQSDPFSRNTQRLSSAGADEVSPSLGLAGPKAKNVDISPGKLAWVDEVMEQAKNGGAEKKGGGGESVVGDLGKVGRTRRVFFKSRKEGRETQ